MKNIKKLISWFLVLSMLLSVAACGKKKPSKEPEKTASASSSQPENIFNELQNSEKITASDPNGFDNTDGTSSYYNTSSEEQPTYQYDPSYLLSGENQFYYEGEGYVYGITEDGKEVIGFLENNGTIIDILEGGGEYSVSNGSRMFSYGRIKEMTKTLVDGEYCLMLTYEAEGESGSMTALKNTYVFHRNSITVTAEVDTVSNSGKVKSASLLRSYLNDVKKTEKKILYNWVYPENGDYPYQKSNGICTKQWLDDNHAVYFYNRDPNQGESFYLPDVPENYFLAATNGEKGFSYSLTYDLVLENAKKTKNVDYDAFFKGEDSEFAVGIFPITDTKDNSTVFVGDEAKLNLNLTNLTGEDLTFSLRYDVMDYYGNIVDAGLFTNSTVFKGSEANRVIKVSGTHGMYWINFYVVSPLSSYYECYPFMLVDDYKFLYRNDSPFGIDALHAYSDSEMYTNASICEKIGVRYARGGTDNALLAEKGIKASAVAAGGPFTSQATLNKVLAKWEEGKKYGGYDYMVGVNEYDGDVKYNLEACREKMKQFLPGYFNLIAPFVQKNGIKFAYNASTHANEAWHQAMYENGVWQASNVIDTHYYCYPFPPDKLSTTIATRENELNMETMLSLFEKYGGREEKLYSIGETGYPTSPEGSTHINEQADYNTRMGILALAHGADRVNYYSLLDRTSYYKGTGTWAEMNFGAFMCYDYYDVVKPKPWAAAYANMTRQLDGVTAVKENPKYDTEGEGTVRAFDVEKRHGDNLIVAWSNIYVQPQATSKGVSNGLKRQPNLPWENIWPESENVTFDAVGKTVTVIDIMGNVKGKYTAVNGKVTIPLNGSPVYIYGVK